MSQDNLLALAKQGDVQAIASLMNRSLQPKGITAKVALKDTCLQVMLESAQLSNQKALAEFVQKGVTALGIPSIERVKVYGKQIGDDFPAWSNEFEIVRQAPTPLLSVNIESTVTSEKLKNNTEYYDIEGSNGQIRLTRNRIIISRKGTTSFITQGLKGDKEIPISRITAIQFKRADALTKGYLQFSIQGGIESRGGVFAAVTDENTVMFTELEESEFEEVKRYINSVVDGEPINFDELRFSELKNLREINFENQQKAIASAQAAEKIFWNKAIKPLFISTIILFILVTITPVSAFKGWCVVLLITSSVFLCIALGGVKTK
ncbi:DUF4429 domain-containing protein [Cuspidothrix issatschenkoi LEGE 03284]|jgi:hypothetical protein|uniref:DUF4429 domain-containing protein n=1 Tax=Cuspidothrix issatschenkoi TaxID=230752 RepID=UPI0018815EA8|nr:DUF4429 domain-containing protein [Cuspidothrix issatschenkoi]MBE9233877.1 DUF4429 domain-containing protein [Cuspidothrix issatschenkoi LEGE 03284]